MLCGKWVEPWMEKGTGRGTMRDADAVAQQNKLIPTPGDRTVITNIVILEWKTIQSASVSQDEGGETITSRMFTRLKADEASVL